jgi:hypothetical protein
MPPVKRRVAPDDRRLGPTHASGLRHAGLRQGSVRPRNWLPSSPRARPPGVVVIQVDTSAVA